MSTPRTILVTGATSGIGRATALACAQAGHTVIASGRRAHLLDELVADGAGRIHALVLDVDDLEACAAAPQACELLVSRSVDVLVNNAGFSNAGPVELLTPEQLLAQLRTNVIGLHALIHAFVPGMRALAAVGAPRPRIINVSSEMGRVTLPFHGAYNASKHAVEALSNAARMELRPLGIDVVTIEPGITRSEFEQVAIGNLRATLADHPTYDGVADSFAQVYMRAYRGGHDSERVGKLILRCIERRRAPIRGIFPLTRIYVALDRITPMRITDWVKTRLIFPWRPGAAKPTP